MERRKFLLGMGSLAAGGAAALGTGAVETITSDGDLAVEVVGSESALLGIVPNDDSQFVEDGSPVRLDFSGGGKADGD